jgi:hypothetical protein
MGSRLSLLALACMLLGSCGARTSIALLPAPESTPTSSAIAGAGSRSNCPVTRPPATPFVPPAEYSAIPPAGQFWYGTPELWTMLEDGGVWNSLPQTPTGYTQKLMWWRQGYRMEAEPMPDLTVTGRRLDAPAPPLVVSPASNASSEFGESMLLGAEIPCLGCWEITGHYHGRQLSYTVWVEP